MKQARFLISIAVLVLLGAGYLGSQFYAFSARAPEWASKVDTPAIAWLALFVLLGAIALALVPEREENP